MCVIMEINFLVCNNFGIGNNFVNIGEEKVITHLNIFFFYFLMKMFLFFYASWGSSC